MERCSWVLDEKAGRQCSKSSKISVANGAHGFCWVHWGKWKREKDNLKSTPEPWDMFKLDVIPDLTKISRDAAKNIRKMLRMFPGVSKENGEDGLIYCFKLHEDCDDPLYHKIGFVGRVDRLADRLDNEWRDCNLIAKWPVKYPDYAEALIHLYLNHYRVHRWVMYAAKASPGRQKRYISTWYGTDDIVSDALMSSETCPKWLPDHLWNVDNAPRDISLKTKAAERYRMEDEWFYCDYNYIQAVIECVVKLLSSDLAKSSESWYSVFQ
jgi:hypothetical protein